MNSSYSGHGIMVSFCEHGNERSGLIKSNRTSELSGKNTFVFGRSRVQISIPISAFRHVFRGFLQSLHENIEILH
jgi:hypothetical protein